MTHILRQPISAIVVLLSLLSLTQAQTPSTAGDVFANARQLYAQEGASKALPEFEKALALFQKDGNRKSEAITIGLIGNCYKKLGQNQKALEFLQRALTMKQELGDKSEQGRTLSHLGLFYWETGDYTKALENYNNARTIANQIGDRNLEAAIYNNIGLVYDEIGDPSALEQYNRAMDIYREMEPSSGKADAIGNIGGWHMLRGNYAESLRYYQQALEVDEALKLKPRIALDLQNIGLALTGLGRNQEAIQTLDRAISLSHDGGSVKDEATVVKQKRALCFN